VPRPVVFPPSMTLHAASGQARVRWQGKDFYLGPWQSEQARQRYTELLVKLTAPSHPGEPSAPRPPGLLVCDVLARWLIHCRTYYSERGRETAQFRLALRPLERLYGMTPARDFGPDELEQLQTAMLTGSWMGEADRAHPRAVKVGGWSRRVVNSRIKRIRTVWRWAERQKLVAAGAWESLRTVQAVRRNRPGARDPEKPRTTDLSEVKRVCRHLCAVLRATVLVQFWTGARTSEVRTMRASDVDTTGDVWSYRPREHKTDYLGHRRTIFLGPRARAVLAPWLALAAARGPDSAVFPSPRGEGVWTQDGHAHAIHRAAVLAGLPQWHCYLCRHSARMRLSRDGSDEQARASLGQRSLDISLQYGTLDEQLAMDAARRLG
jgi:integrase